MSIAMDKLKSAIFRVLILTFRVTLDEVWSNFQRGPSQISKKSSYRKFWSLNNTLWLATSTGSRASQQTNSRLAADI
jgi:hypothetical protein